MGDFDWNDIEVVPQGYTEPLSPEPYEPQQTTTYQDFLPDKQPEFSWEDTEIVGQEYKELPKPKDPRWAQQVIETAGRSVGADPFVGKSMVTSALYAVTGVEPYQPEPGAIKEFFEVEDVEEMKALTEGWKSVIRNTAQGIETITRGQPGAPDVSKYNLEDPEDFERYSRDLLEARRSGAGDGTRISKAMDMLANAKNLQPDYDYYSRLEDKGKLSKFIENVYGMAPQMSTQIAAHIATGGLGSGAFMALQIAGGEYENLIAQGVSDKRAREAAWGSALMQAPLEAISLGWALRNPIGQKLIKGALMRFGAGKVLGGITEGLTETVQNIPSTFMEEWAKDPNFINKLKRNPELVKDLTARAIEEGLPEGYVGAFYGFLLGGSGDLQTPIKKPSKVVTDPTAPVKRKTDAQELLNQAIAGGIPEVVAAPDIGDVEAYTTRQMEPIEPIETIEPEVVEMDEADFMEIKRDLETAEIDEADIEIIPQEPEAAEAAQEVDREIAETGFVAPLTKDAIALAEKADEKEAATFPEKAKEAEAKSDALRAEGKLEEAMTAAYEAQKYREADQYRQEKLKVPQRKKPEPSQVKMAEGKIIPRRKRGEAPRTTAKRLGIPSLEDWRKTYTVGDKVFMAGVTTRRAKKINRQIDAAYYAKYPEMQSVYRLAPGVAEEVPKQVSFKKVEKVLGDLAKSAWKSARTKFTPTERARIQKEVGERKESLVDLFHYLQKASGIEVERGEIELAEMDDTLLAAKQFAQAIGAPAIEFVKSNNKGIKKIAGSTILVPQEDGTLKAEGVVIVANSNLALKYPLLNVLGHESMHVLQTEAPDLYAKFLDFMWENKSEEHWELFAAQAMMSEPTRYDPTSSRVMESASKKNITPQQLAYDRIRKEWTAYYAGQTWMQPEFIEKMQKKLPDVMGKLLDIMMEMLRRFNQIVKNDPKIFTNVGSVIKAENYLADIYQEFIERKNKKIAEENRQWDELAADLYMNMIDIPGVETIKSSVVKVRGKYYTGKTHGDAIFKVKQQLGFKTLSIAESHIEEFAYKSSTGRIIGRDEAKYIAEKAGQLKHAKYRYIPTGALTTEDFKEGELVNMSKKLDDALKGLDKKTIKGYATENRDDILRLLKITAGTVGMESFLKKAGVPTKKAKRIAAIAGSMDDYPFPEPSWTARELEKFDKENPEYKFWYEKTRWLADVFEDKSDLDLFRGLALLSHTSRNKGTLANMVEFVKAWTRWHAGEPVTSGLVEQETIDRVLNAETLAKMFNIRKTKLGFEEGDVKVKAFAEAFAATMRKNKELRNALKTVVDIWMNRYFFPTRYNVAKDGTVTQQPLSAIQHDRIQQHMREVESILSKKTGTRWTSDMAQAALWFYVRENYEVHPDYEAGQVGYDFDQTLKIIAAKWAGIADKFASNEITHSYILMKLRDPRVRFILDHYTSKDNDFKMALTSFQGSGLFTGEEWNNKPEDANRPMRIHFFEAGDITGEVQGKIGATKRMRAVIETGQIYNLDQDTLGLKVEHDVMPQDHYSLAAMENDMIKRGFVGFQTDNKVVMFEPTRVHEMKKYYLSISPEASKKVIKAVEKEITKLDKTKDKGGYTKQILRSILSNMRYVNGLIEKGQLDDLQDMMQDQLNDLLKHPLNDIAEILPSEGRWEGGAEPSVSVVMEAGDIDVLKGQVAQFLQYNGQYTGIISEVVSEVGDRARPYSKKDEKGNPIYDVAANQAPSVMLSFNEELDDADLKDLDTFLSKNGFGGSTYIPGKRVVLLHHIPKYQSRSSFLNSAMQAILDIGHLDPLFNKIAKKYDGFNQVWFKHHMLENPWKEKPRGQRYENLIKKGYVTGRDIGFTASPEVVAGAREKRERLAKEGKDIFTFASRQLDPKAKTGEAQFVAKTVYDTPKATKQMMMKDMDVAEDYALTDNTAGYSLSPNGMISNVWSTKEGRGALAVLSAISNGGKYSVVEKGPQVEWFEGFGFEVTNSEGNRTMMQQREGNSNDPFILAGIFESTWNKQLDADPDSADILNEIVRQYGETIRTGLGKTKSEQIKKTNSEYLQRNWLNYNNASKQTDRGILNPYKNIYVKTDPELGQEDRTLLIQISSNKLREEATTVGDAYFDTLYSKRDGYIRPVDFWEVPDWMARAAKNFDADVYIVRNVNEAIRFLNDSKYKHIMMSVMDSNKNVVKRVAQGFGERVDLGGYVNKEYFADMNNVEWFDNLEEAYYKYPTKKAFDPGYDYSHFKGTETVPRLEMSKGCLYRCAFCTVPKKVVMVNDDKIMQQVEAFGDLKYKLIYLNDKTFGQAKNYKSLTHIYHKIRKTNKDFQGFIVQTTATDFNKMDREWLKDHSFIKYVELGAESLNDDILKKLTKPHRVGHLEMAANKIRGLGMKYIPNVIVGLAGVENGKLWTETAETYQNTLDHLEKHKDIISHVNAYVLATYEGTRLNDQLKSDNEADSDENVIAKSWLKDQEVHEKFYNDVLAFATQRLNEGAEDVSNLKDKETLSEADVQKVVDSSMDEFDADLAKKVAKSTQNLSNEQISQITSQFESRRSYANAPDWMMGFSQDPFKAKSFFDQNYPVTIKVKVTMPDQTFEDEIKGLNVYHALERANRNWDGATIELLDQTGKEIKAEWMREPDIEHQLEVSADTKRMLKEKIGFEYMGVMERAKESVRKWGKNWRQQAFDRMHPIAKELGGEDGEVYMRHRAVPGVMSTLAAFLEHGKLYWDQTMVPTVRTQQEGFIKWLNQGLGKDADKFFYWVIAKRAETLEEQDRERWLDENTRDRILEWVGEPTQKGMTWEKYNDEFQAFNKNVLDFAEQAGLFSADQRASWEQEFYIPFYRVMEDSELREQYLSAPSRGKIHLSSQIRRLYGAEAKIGDPIQNIIRNWSNLIGESMANTARSSAYDYAMANPTMTEDGVPMIETASLKDVYTYKPKKVKAGEPKIVYVHKKTGEPVLSFMSEGKKVYFKVNDVELYNALSMVNRPYFDNILMKAFGTTKHWLTYGATFGPAFKVKNMIRDALHAYTIVPGFRPWQVFKGIASTWNKDEDFVEFMASGNSFTGSYIRAEDPKAMEKYLKSVMPRENIADKLINKITQKEGKTAVGRILDTPRKLLDFWERIGDASENAVRIAIFRKYKEEEGRLVAGFKARDVMDFQMSGASSTVQLLIQTIPFLNARAQGLYKMGREARKNPVSYLTKGATVGIASIILWAIFKDDDRYKELEDWEKWTYYHFWVGDDHFRIPKPFETGVVWSSMFETFGNVFNGTEDGRHILDFTKHALGETLAFNPIPQLARPIAEQWFNEVFFTGRPIEGMRLERLNWGERYDPWTSETMRLAGKLGIPPKRAETFIRGYFSTIGMLFLTTSDFFVRNAFDFPERPELAIDRYPLIGAFYRTAQNQNTKFATRFYDMANETDKVYSTIKFYRDLGKHEYADMLTDKHEKALIFRQYFNTVQKDLRDLNNDIRNIWLDTEITGKEKRAELDILYNRKNELLRQLFQDYEGELDNG
jgi:radical SAM superfamily enzyme YgiQ (UPF0313 family)